MRVRIANGDRNFASSPSPKLAVQSHEPGRESSTTFVLLLSISTYYFYKSSLSGFRIAIPGVRCGNRRRFPARTAIVRHLFARRTLLMTVPSLPRGFAAFRFYPLFFRRRVCYFARCWVFLRPDKIAALCVPRGKSCAACRLPPRVGQERKSRTPARFCFISKVHLQKARGKSTCRVRTRERSLTASSAFATFNL